jgi:hypothetical protein
MNCADGTVYWLGVHLGVYLGTLGVYLGALGAVGALSECVSLVESVSSSLHSHDLTLDENSEREYSNMAVKVCPAV